MTATCGTPRPKATLDASTEEKETAESGFQSLTSFASFMILSALATSFPYGVPPPCLPTTTNRSFLRLRACCASRYTRVVMSTSLSRERSSYRGAKNRACFGVRTSIQMFTLGFHLPLSAQEKVGTISDTRSSPPSFSIRNKDCIRV